MSGAVIGSIVDVLICLFVQQTKAIVANRSRNDFIWVLELSSTLKFRTSLLKCKPKIGETMNADHKVLIPTALVIGELLLQGIHDKKIWGLCSLKQGVPVLLL
jgi:hypothetical protein